MRGKRFGSYLAGAGGAVFCYMCLVAQTFGGECLVNGDFSADVTAPILGLCTVEVSGFGQEVVYAFLDLRISGGEGSVVTAYPAGESSETSGLIVNTSEARMVTLNITEAVLEAIARQDSVARVVLAPNIIGEETSYTLGEFGGCRGVFRCFESVGGEIVQTKAAGAGIEEDGIVSDVAAEAKVTPNPGNPIVSISARAGQSGEVRVTLHDVRGRVVRELWGGGSAGEWVRMTWDGKDDRGVPVASGTYLYHITSGDDRGAVGKVAVVR